MRKIAIFAIVAALAVSCGKPDDDPKNNPLKPIELSTKSVELVQKGDTFGLAFLEQVNAAATKDYIISPLSMQILLGMVLNGAQGETAAQICNVLGYGAGDTPAVNEFCLSMLQQLPALDKKTKLTLANAIFVDDGWPLLDTYKQNVGKYYMAEVSNLDFGNNEASLKAINGWCSKQTNGLIPKVLDEVNHNILAYLLNALYFKSQWTDKFNTSLTAQEAFTAEDGTKSTVSMMKRLDDAQYTEDEVFRAVRLPYGNGAFSMTVFLPQQGNKLADVVGRLKKIGWGAVRESMRSYEVDLWLPKFETKYHIELNDILSAMGMPLAFDRMLADFTAMSPYALCLSFVQQDAVIKVDEDGAEAAAISVAGMEKCTSAGPGETVVFHADQPFLYLISEASTGAILFAGRFGAK